MKLNKMYITVGSILVIIGLFFIVKPFVYKAIASHNQNVTVQKYKSEQSKNESSRIPKNKSKVAGTLEINSVGIKTPIYPGKATPEQLNRGVSFASSDEKLTNQNISIAGHTSNINSKYQFTPLKHVSTGDEVKLTVGNEKRIYKMSDIKMVKPTDVAVMDEHKNQKHQITLITCDNFNPNTGIWEDRKIYIAKYIKTTK